MAAPGKNEWSIPVKQAVPILVVALSMITFMLNEQHERREMRARVDAFATDRFKGTDMDRFLERLQVSLDAHTRLDQKPIIEVPTWRHR